MLQLTQRAEEKGVHGRAVLAGQGQERQRYFIASQEDLYTVSDCLQFLMPGLGPLVWGAWQIWSTVLCVAGSLMFLPLFLVLNRGKVKTA